MRTRAFTLLELAVVTAIIGVLALILLPSLANQMEEARTQAEEARLGHLASLIERSFRSGESRENVSNFSLQPMVADVSTHTVFDAGAEAERAISPASWCVKLARLEGVAEPRGEEVTPEEHPGVWRYVENAAGQRRWLVAGPAEAGQQRYLLLSLLAPPRTGLTVPASDGSAAWFDAVWNHEWDTPGALLPADWLARLGNADINAWLEGPGDTTRVHLLRVRRIVQPKHAVIVNNTHPLYSAWVDYDGANARLTSAPGSGVSTTPEIPAGRLIVVRRGLTAPGAEACRFYLHEPTSVTVQP